MTTRRAARGARPRADGLPGPQPPRCYRRQALPAALVPARTSLTASQQLGKTDFYLALPPRFALKTTDGPDLQVYYFAPADTTVQADFSGRLYFGGYPPPAGQPDRYAGRLPGAPGRRHAAGAPGPIHHSPLWLSSKRVFATLPPYSCWRWLSVSLRNCDSKEGQFDAIEIGRLGIVGGGAVILHDLPGFRPAQRPRRHHGLRARGRR